MTDDYEASDRQALDEAEADIEAISDPDQNVWDAIGDPEAVTPDGVSEVTIEPKAHEPVFYGGEGFGTVRRRNLLVLIPLPVYLLDAARPERGIDKSLQNMMLADDIRLAMAKAARKLNDTASKYRVTGYDWDLNEIQYDMPQARTLSATLVIERE